MLAKLRIPTAGLKGTWLVLDTDEAVRAAAAHRMDKPMQLRHQAQSTSAASSCVADDAVLQGSRALRGAARAGHATPRSKEDVDEDPNVKVIVLGSFHRGGAASSFSWGHATRAARFEIRQRSGAFHNRCLAAQ